MRDRETAEKSVGEKGSEVGLDILDGEMAEERVLRVGKPHRQRNKRKKDNTADANSEIWSTSVSA